MPEQHTDFIFTVAGEELGFVGAGGIVVLLGVILWRGCRIATRRLATCIWHDRRRRGSWPGSPSRSFQNIGMTLGIMPVTGLPLPLLSYGGSSTFAMWTAVGLLLAIRVRSRSRM